jgi:hypothetical protein
MPKQKGKRILPMNGPLLHEQSAMFHRNNLAGVEGKRSILQTAESLGWPVGLNINKRTVPIPV